MTGLPPYSPSLGDVLPLFESGDSEQLREFTRGIENRPNMVLEFERAFDALMHEGAIDWEGRLAKERLEQVDRRHPVYRAALQLVVNALCYMTAYPDDITSVWPQGTPVSLKEKADNGQGKEAMRAKSKLAALG